MKLLTLLAIAVALSGCGRGSTDLDMAKQDYVCEGHGGAYSYRTILRSAPVTCVDGSEKDWKGVTMPDQKHWPEPAQGGDE